MSLDLFLQISPGFIPDHRNHTNYRKIIEQCKAAAFAYGTLAESMEDERKPMELDDFEAGPAVKDKGRVQEREMTVQREIGK